MARNLQKAGFDVAVYTRTRSKAEDFLRETGARWCSSPAECARGKDVVITMAAWDLIRRILSFSPPKAKQPNLLVLHASNYKTSNTLALWSRVREHLEPACTITEIGLRNGTLEDCSGCPYTMP